MNFLFWPFALVCRGDSSSSTKKLPKDTLNKDEICLGGGLPFFLSLVYRVGSILQKAFLGGAEAGAKKNRLKKSAEKWSIGWKSVKKDQFSANFRPIFEKSTTKTRTKQTWEQKHQGTKKLQQARKRNNRRVRLLSPHHPKPSKSKPKKQQKATKNPQKERVGLLWGGGALRAPHQPKPFKTKKHKIQKNEEKKNSPEKP